MVEETKGRGSSYPWNFFEQGIPAERVRERIAELGLDPMEKFVLDLKELLRFYDKMDHLATSLCVADMPDQEKIEQFRLMLGRQSLPRLDLFNLSARNVCERFVELMDEHDDYVTLSDKLSCVPRLLRWLFWRQYRKLNLMREMYSPAAFMTAVIEEGERRIKE